MGDGKVGIELHAELVSYYSPSPTLAVLHLHVHIEVVPSAYLELLF